MGFPLGNALQIWVNSWRHGKTRLRTSIREGWHWKEEESEDDVSIWPVKAKTGSSNTAEIEKTWGSITKNTGVLTIVILHKVEVSATLAKKKKKCRLAQVNPEITISEPGLGLAQNKQAQIPQHPLLPPLI